MKSLPVWRAELCAGACNRTQGCESVEFEVKSWVAVASVPLRVSFDLSGSNQNRSSISKELKEAAVDILGPQCRADKCVIIPQNQPQQDLVVDLLIRAPIW